MPTNSTALSYIFHHLFLPPKLPQNDDFNIQYEIELLSTVIDGLLLWKRFTTPARREHAEAAIITIQNMRQAYSGVDGSLSEAKVRHLLATLTEDAVIPLLVREQNAGVLISKSKNGIFFDAFEISPSNHDTMTTRGRLQRSFPGASVVVGESIFQQCEFKDAITLTLVDMSKHPVEAMQPKSKKAGSAHHEDRDTNHPGMISEVLYGVLRAVGEPANCPIIIKNMRDDILWNDARSPWRRSQLWVLIRVTLQLSFNRKTTPAEADTVYKEAIIFILCRVLELAKDSPLSSEVLFLMNAKLSKRLQKIGSAIDAGARCYVQDIMKGAYVITCETWSAIQQRASKNVELRKLSELDFVADTCVSIPELDTYIDWISSRRREQITGSFRPASTLMVFPPDDLPQLPHAFSNDDRGEVIANLEAFETWVEHHCLQWSRTNVDVACIKLCCLMESYHILARPYYLHNPEAYSAMLLTIFELWVACDEAAVSLSSFLGEYDPGIPIHVLQNLLLPFQSQIQRLYNLESHLNERSSAARFQPRKLYFELDSQDCFPVRCFDESVELKAAYKHIVEGAARQKEAKLKELENLKAKHDDLISMAQDMEHEDTRVLIDYTKDCYELKHMKNSCKKCGYEMQAANLQIDVHEWPLPQSVQKAKAVIFERFIPSYFQSWRQATFYLLRNTIGMEYNHATRPVASYSLENDPHLPRGSSCSSYIGLLSEEKPVVVTHWHSPAVSTATPRSVCVDNGLNYRYFDSEVDQFIEPFALTPKVLELCTYKLPQRSKGLQNYLSRPASSPDGPAPNNVLADQSETPMHMAIEEMKDLAILPLGHLIQLYNILLQLAAPSVDFKKEETAIFILQCLYQAGPRDNKLLRASHTILDDRNFSRRLLESVETAWHRVRENWESAQAVIVFAAITTRVMSLTSSEEIQQQCLDILRALRTGTFAWAGLLKDKSHKGSTEDDREYLKSKSVDIALICASCFDVEGRHLSIILGSESDASIFVQCSILIQEGKRVRASGSDLILDCLHDRFGRLLYRSLFILSETHSGISHAVKKSWSAFCPRGDWQIANNTSHWLVTETVLNEQSIHLWVHYNLLSGELLVNGIPLSSPPLNYEAHPIWPKLFGRTSVEVMPTTVAGMEFSAKRQHEGYDLHFGLRMMFGGSDLLVQASNPITTYETIPARLIREIFPAHFSCDFIHWYDLKNDRVEFRRLESPWDSDGSAWVLSRSTRGWRLRNKAATILGVNSTTSTNISNLLMPLAEKFDIHILIPDDQQSSLEVEIPALQLGFYLSPGGSMVRSREFRGMSIDNDQSLGTLIGFSNKLILKDSNRRLVLVPEGLVSWQPDHNHIRITVAKPSLVKVHSFYVDSELGQLIDNGDLQGKLFVSYLHALTSYYLPDPLTRRTGVEQALWTLNSAGVRSFDQLSPSHVDILIKIARLTPRREYYPRRKQEMQTVSWEPDLSCLSQHNAFFKIVASIFGQAKRMSLFYPSYDTTLLDLGNHIDTNEHLIERDCIRASTFCISGFGAEDHTVAYDVRHRGRDRDQASCHVTHVYALSSIVYHGHTALHTNIRTNGWLWERFSSTESMRSAESDLRVSELRYSARTANSKLDFSQWPTIHRFLSAHSATANKFNIMFWLSALAINEKDISLSQVLALFFTTDEFKHTSLSSLRYCHPVKGHEVSMTRLETIVGSTTLPWYRSPEVSMVKHPWESHSIFENRRDDQYQYNKAKAVHALSSRFLEQWPREELLPLDHVETSIRDYVNFEQLESTMSQYFREWYSNRLLFTYTQQLESILLRLSCSPLSLWYLPEPIQLAPSSRTCGFISVGDVFANAAPMLSNPIPEVHLLLSSDNHEKKAPCLSGLIDSVRHFATQSSYENSYLDGLQASMLSLESLKGQKPGQYLSLRATYSMEYLCQHWEDCKEYADSIYVQLTSTSRNTHSEALQLGHGPRYSPLFFIQQLSHGAWEQLSQEWKKCIALYGLALTACQRAERLFKAASSQSDEDLVKELLNIRTWDPMEHPEWLLLEIESKIMIRGVQKLIACEMKDPGSGSNAVMQLNMGEGKSSVIVPMVATELANGSRLVRVIVAKPQSKQMIHMLTSKLGNLLDRRVYHMPFSRSLRIDSTEKVNIIGEILRECKDTGGVLLVQPEHLLSFQLLGIECYCGKDPVKQNIGKSLIGIQDFFDHDSRDIVDESDENFSPKFELVYTIGSQQPIELGPARWACMQQILDLVRSLAPEVADRLPGSLDIDVNHQNNGGFPKIRILKTDAGKLLVEKVAEHICNKGFDGFPIARQQEDVRKTIFKYITQYNLSKQEIEIVEMPDHGAFWTESTKPLLLLLRGILGGGLLTYVLSQKRWRVNFGSTNTRSPPTKLAVPYRAKDNPTPRSEFSHPDVVIALTQLTYYYGGLENEELFTAFEHLVDSDQASVEYSAWMKDSPHMPASFRQLEGINLKDRPQCVNDIFPHLRRGKSVIDYFLGHIVFPKQLKEFPHKLSASGWDIGKAKDNVTTGFSGTNDSSKLLPTDIKHLDLPSQTHTNALVLEYLLQPENSTVLLPLRADIGKTDAEHFIETVIKLEKPARVILDVGAQILEMNNLEVAQSWLSMVSDTKTQAVVFVDDDDELSIVDRRGRVELLQTSSYATQLDSCLVFLDEAHTRGIDLKMPEDYRAAVTLGANVTKDRLVQACMRLRKLGKGQSVIFCINAEIEAKIQERTGISPDTAIKVEHVLHWAISETFAEIKRSMPLWAAQGDRFLHQEEIWAGCRADGDTTMTHSAALDFLEDEAQSIYNRYRPRSAEDTTFMANTRCSGSAKLDEIRERCNEVGCLDFHSSTLEEEQERELSPEIENERQVQRPPPAQPVEHILHHDIETFVATGHMVPRSTGYMQAFSGLQDTSAAQDFDASQLSGGHLFVTTDFISTVKASENGHVSDLFQRPVQWIISSHAEGSDAIDNLLIISPYEAEQLMPKFKSSPSARVTLHLYKPRSHTVHRSFDRLDFYSIPDRPVQLKISRALLVQLNLFAGQLYFTEFEDYQETCRFLGLADDVPKEGEVVATDGYILRDVNGESKFDKSPVKFLQILTSTIRRNGQHISKTHVGSLLDGKLLQKSDIEE
ncbi:hypothetical protein F4777DRAFT_549550 [Nemania sp. FL0916]|nr:hypothetical protein F4777DRAFT_549550 [Nemania sp. FL0916]